MRSLTKKISVIILAAGKSSRFGQNKLLYVNNNSGTFLDILFKTYKKFICADNIIIVTGYEKYKNDIQLAAAEYKIQSVHNPDYEKGMFTSIKAGISKIDNNSECFIIQPADCIYITLELLKNMRKAFESLSSEKSILIPSFNNRRGHPPFFNIKHKKNILLENDDFNMRIYLSKYENEIKYYKCSNKNILIDIDTVEELNKIYNNVNF